jgi:hypothetical protein
LLDLGAAFSRLSFIYACGDILPAELENAYYRHNRRLAEAGRSIA